MNWYEIVRLILAILKILDMLPKEKKSEAQTKIFEAVAKVVADENIT